MEGFLFALFFAGIVVIALGYGVVASKGKRSGAIASAKFPPTFSSSLSSNEVLAVVEARLKTIQSIRAKWKTTEKVEKVGRLQSMLTVPYNLAGDNIRISFLMNLLATNKEAGGCTVEWNYVMMSPLSTTPPEIALIEDEIYKKTTLETRAALFIAQGDSDEAAYLQAQTAQPNNEIETRSALVQLIAAAADGEVSTTAKQELFEDSHAATQEVHIDRSVPNELFEDKVVLPQDSIKVPPAPEIEDSNNFDEPEMATPIMVSSNIPGTPLPDIVGEVLKEVAAVGTTSDPSRAAIPNPLNFSPPDPALPSAASAPEAKCVKCSQARDPAFDFCLYCGHTDA